jgi:hypothetical protein
LAADPTGRATSELRAERPHDVPDVVTPGRHPLGEYAVSFESFREDVDPAPYLEGLPDNP